jgi:hypothetical protein|tara:strand:- start:42 stop:905 length:864 start_codon:yes stop_codon:yes gene_type:complete
MTPGENLLSMYRRQGYQHAPVHLNFCPSLLAKYKSLAGDTPLPEYFDYADGFAARLVPGLALKPWEEVDWLHYYDEPLRAGTDFSAYGVAHEPGSDAAHHMRRMHHPMANVTSLEEMQSYPFPQFDTDDVTHMCEAVSEAHAEGRAAVGSMHCTIWETAWYIRDMTKLMIDMMDEDDKATFLLDVITEHACQRAAGFARAGMDMIEFGDDVGMQDAIMISREMYRDWLQPRLIRVISAAKRENPNVLIFYHSCGFVEPLIDDLIEAGVEILNPVQPECMPFDGIHDK